MGAATVSIPSTGTQVATATSVVTPTTLTPGLPATRANGDVLLCFTCCRSSTPTVSISGWTQILNVAATNGRIALFALRVDGSEVAPSVVWAGLTTGNSGTGAMAQLAAVRGLNASLALSSLADVVGSSNDQAASTTAAAGGAAITPTWNGAMVLSLTVRLDDAGSWSTLGAAENVTWANVAAAFGSASGSDEAQDWQWGQQSTAGLIAAKTKTLSGASSFASSGAMVALKPLIVVPLASAAAAATPTLAVNAPTQVPLGSASAAAAPALTLSAPTGVPLGSAAVAATAALALRAATAVPLDTAAASATSSLALSAPTVVTVGAATTTSAPSLALSAPTSVPLDQAGAQASTALSAAAPTEVPLSSAEASASVSFALQAATSLALQEASASATGSATLTAPAVTGLDGATGLSSAALAISVPTSISVDVVVGTCAGSLDLTAGSGASATEIPLDEAEAASDAALALGAPSLITVAASAQSDATVVFRVPAGLAPDAAYAAVTAILAIHIHHAVGITEGGSAVSRNDGQTHVSHLAAITGGAVPIEPRAGVTGAIEGR